jgi:3-methyladenine DNA glycosylase AlkD
MPINPAEYVAAVRELYASNANPVDAPFMQRYMKDQFPFFGIKNPMRVLLSQQIIQKYGVPEGEDLKEVCRFCFGEEEREMQYFVNDLCKKVIKKLDDGFLEVFESLLVQKSWWDTVDFLSPKLAGKILQNYPTQITNYPDRWIESDNKWLQRSAILFQLDYKEKTDAPLLFRYILRRSDSKEFFVQKAAGWALREYSKRNPEAVQNFIAAAPLPRLTVREGLKRVNKIINRSA